MGKRRKEYKPDQNVMLILTEAKEAPKGLKRFDHDIFKVNRVMHLHDTCFTATTTWTYYELTGCESDKGVPYAILADWLYDMDAFIGDE